MCTNHEAILARLPLFATLPRDEMRRLAVALRPRVVDAGAILLHEGEAGDNLYIVVDGHLDIVTALGDASERLVAVRSRGDMVGEMSLLTGDGVRTASVRARSAAQLLELTRVDFDALVRPHSAFAYELLRMLGTHLRDTHRAMIDALQEQNLRLEQANAELKSAQSRIVAQAEARARLDQELHVAQMIQQQFLPRALPTTPGWQVATYYRAAGAVGGDFYDVVALPGGRLGLVAGDVCGKGVPAALVMATTQSILRGEAPRHASPGPVLEQVNDRLVREIPVGMHATCLHVIVDLETGALRVANAGHNFPVVRTKRRVFELAARGLPLGMLPHIAYEEVDARLEPGDSLFLYSDGLVEARNGRGELWGFPAMLKAFEETPAIEPLLRGLEQFTGQGAEQEDDISLVIVTRQ